MISTLYAAGGQMGGAEQGGNPIMSLLPFVLIILVMYFLMIRPQSKKQKEKKLMLEGLQTGDEILTIGGVYGKIDGINEKDNKLIVTIAKNVKINIARSAVADKVVKK